MASKQFVAQHFGSQISIGIYTGRAGTVESEQQQSARNGKVFHEHDLLHGVGKMNVEKQRGDDPEQGQEESYHPRLKSDYQR